MKLHHCLILGSFFLVTTAKSQYDPTKIFVDNFYNYKGDNVRSASGKPASGYWQNQADYTVKASFDVGTYLLTGEVAITYTNSSPDDLKALWLQLDQNTARPQARGNQLVNPDTRPDDAKGYSIAKVRILKENKWRDIPYIVDGTRMQIRLSEPVKPMGKVQLSIEYSFTLQAQGGGDRSGYMDTENGKIYEFSYWYPRMCVYDDFHGWNTLPFIGGGEMYLDYGTIDYQITVPADQVVVGSGTLVNESDVLNDNTLKRLAEARGSDKTVVIRGAREVKKTVTKNKTANVTWHFRMENTRDVAWAMSTGYLWDAAKINLPNGKSALAQSVYPEASTKDNKAWGRSTEMLKASVEDFSNRWFVYPYSTATSVAGPVGGMEFPGLAFNHWDVDAYEMLLLASHEIGHTWFPMIVGSDERRYPFMDEGFNTFIDIYAHNDFNKGEFAPKRDGEYAPGGGNPADEIIKVIEDCKNGPTLMTPPDGMDYKYVHPLSYFKSAFGLVLLRDVILGHDKFDYAFRQYIHNWAYKHPGPEDFFRSIENGSGEDLSWFWQGWFYHNWQLDQAVTTVVYNASGKTAGATITVDNNKQMVMPILVRVEESNGKTHEFKVPVEVWKFGKTAHFHVNTTSTINRIILDANHQLPDVDRSNNEWEGV
ncbi:M1 family metallopeptidase [Flavobacteriaceae bacterium F89]|uniref:M1 family metallopeptidase n=1 Tax=Cerina litoralis TaxID=2874477 RepID=A0AAE3JU35_9FLAO|nr:M1 family metallopeptidase [Cerina litoralis]MCG2462002.1 M1 family metallopeptidase [Cerina litoralis]